MDSVRPLTLNVWSALLRNVLMLWPVLFAGCTNIPASLVPLCSDAEAFHDDRIVGEYRLAKLTKTDGWQAVITEDLVDVLTVTISRMPSRYQVVLQREGDKALPFACKLTKIDQNLYMDLQRPPLEDGTLESLTLRQHFIVRCTIMEDGLRLSGCDPKTFRSKLTELGLPVVEAESCTVFAGTTSQLRNAISEHAETLLPLTEHDPWLRPVTNGRDSANAKIQTQSDDREGN